MKLRELMDQIVSRSQLTEADLWIRVHNATIADRNPEKILQTILAESTEVERKRNEVHSR